MTNNVNALGNRSFLRLKLDAFIPPDFSAIALFVFVWCAIPSATNVDEPATVMTMLTQADSHNDYLYDRPLLNALDQGFCGIEADALFVDGQLLVGHTRWESTRDRKLKKTLC